MMDKEIIELLVAIYELENHPYHDAIVRLLERRGVDLVRGDRGVEWSMNTSGYIGRSEVG